MPVQEAPRVGIHDEYRLMCGVEHDAIGGLRPDAVDRQQRRAQLRRGQREQLLQLAAEPLRDQRGE